MYVELKEGKEIWEYLSNVWTSMQGNAVGMQGGRVFLVSVAAQDSPRPLLVIGQQIGGHVRAHPRGVEHEAGTGGVVAVAVFTAVEARCAGQIVHSVLEEAATLPVRAV